ncbi:FHA domain-containing protein [Coprococcus eutactus]|uniref:FHA domain-containing protein n=3 Tax=Coprococcus eutactus TaxID=33043 RepID=UPI00156FCAD4|nr:FHA domain-containing protein [Coprococcus eutactus]NSD34820.1 FHA domain-containing protein [Coprococcus eutactus]
MKKNKVLLTKTGDTYNCRYVLDQTDIIDEKVDKGVSGKFPQIIPCRLEEKDNQREFIYEIGNKVQLTEFLKKEINKKQMLTLLYNLLSGLEAFGMNMISLSYVAKDIQYVFVAPESLNVYFIVAGVDKEITDLNEVRNFVKDVICNAHYFEMDRDNYVARLITFTNKLGTFSVGDMKEFVNQLLIDMGIHIEEEKKKTEKKEEKTANDKVSRIGVMQNNAKMVQPGASVGGSVPPMPNRQVPPMPNGQPMPGRPMPMQMGPDGKPMNGQPMPGRPMPMQMGPDGKPMNGQPMPGRPMPMQMGPDGKPMNGQPMPGRPMPMQMGPDGKPMPGRPMPMQMGPDGKPMNGQPMPGRPMPMQMGPDGKPMNGQPMPGRPMPMQMGPDGKPMNGQPMPGRPMPMQMGPDGKPMPGRPMPMQMGPDGKPIVPPIPNRPSPSMPEKKPEAAPVPPMPEKKPEAAPVPPMPEKKPETAPVPPVEEKKPQVPVPYLLRIATNEKIYINKPEFSIGRSATKADYTVTDNSDVSRIHCIIERKNGVSYIRDNASTNGTFVNGQNIAGQKNVFLTNNAKVSLGDEGFIYFVR